MVVIIFKERFLKILWKNTWLQRLSIGKVVNMEGDEVNLNKSSVTSRLFQLRLVWLFFFGGGGLI